MNSYLILFTDYKASSLYLRTESEDTDVPLNPLPHLRKGIKSLDFLWSVEHNALPRALALKIFCSSFLEGIFMQKRFYQTESQQNFYFYCAFAFPPAPKLIPTHLISSSWCNYQYLHRELHNPMRDCSSSQPHEVTRPPWGSQLSGGSQRGPQMFITFGKTQIS